MTNLLHDHLVKPDPVTVTCKMCNTDYVIPSSTGRCPKCGWRRMDNKEEEE